MKPSQMGPSKAIKFDFVVPSYSPRKRRLGPKLLPISISLPHDLKDGIKQRYEEGGKVYYVVGDLLQPADRRAVPVRKILEYVSRRTLEEFETSQLQKEEDEREGLLSPSELNTPQLDGSTNAESSGSSGSSTSERDEVETGVAVKKIRVDQKIHAPSPQPSTGMSVGKAIAKALTNTSSEVSTPRYHKLPQTAQSLLKRKRARPFLPDSDSDDEEKPAAVAVKSHETRGDHRDTNVEEDEVELSFTSDQIKSKDTKPRNFTSALFVSSSSASAAQSSSPVSVVSAPAKNMVSKETTSESDFGAKSHKKLRKRKSMSYQPAKKRKTCAKPVHISEDEEWEVNKILEVKTKNGCRYFKLDWVSEYAPSWEPERNISRALIEDFERENPRRRKSSVIDLDNSDEEPSKSNLTPGSTSQPIINLAESDDESVHQPARLVHTSAIQADEVEDQSIITRSFKQLEAEHYTNHIRREESSSPQISKAPSQIESDEDEEDQPIPQRFQKNGRASTRTILSDDAAEEDEDECMDDDRKADDLKSVVTPKQGTDYTAIFGAGVSAVLRDIASEKARINSKHSPQEDDIKTGSALPKSKTPTSRTVLDPHAAPDTSRFQRRSAEEIRSEAIELYSGSNQIFTYASPRKSSSQKRLVPSSPVRRTPPAKSHRNGSVASLPAKYPSTK